MYCADAASVRSVVPRSFTVLIYTDIREHDVIGVATIMHAFARRDSNGYTSERDALKEKERKRKRENRLAESQNR